MNKPEVIELEAQVRDTGKKAVKKLRDDLRVPAVLYGPDVNENIHFSVDELELEKILSVSRTQLQKLTVDGEKYQTLLKQVDFHPVTDRPLHADFYALSEDHKVTLRVPIHLEGVAQGVTEGGGRVFQPMHILRIRVLPENIPADYVLDITELAIGDSLHVRDLELEGIEPLDDLSRTIVTIRPPKSEAMLKAMIEPEAAEEEEVAEGELAEGEEPVEGEAEEGEGGEEEEEPTE